MDEQRQSPLPGAPGSDHSGGGGEQIDARDLRPLGEEGGPIGLRVGRNPANLGDEVPEGADVTYPPPLGEAKQI